MNTDRFQSLHGCAAHLPEPSTVAARVHVAAHSCTPASDLLALADAGVVTLAAATDAFYSLRRFSGAPLLSLAQHAAMESAYMKAHDI